MEDLRERRIGESALDALTHVPPALVRVLRGLDGRPPRRGAVCALSKLVDEAENATTAGRRQEASSRLAAARAFGALLSETARVRDLLQLTREHWEAIYAVWGASDTDWMHMLRGMMACLTRITGSDQDPVRCEVLGMIPVTALPSRSLALTVEQFRRMLAELSDLQFAIVMTIAAAGLRISEYLLLKPQHLVHNTCMLDVPGRKTKKSTGSVSVHPDYWPFVLQAVPTMIGKSAIRYLLKKACRAAGLQGIRVHDLRHCLGHYAGAGGATRPELQTALRHESPEMTQRYMAPPDLTSVAGAFHATVGAANALRPERLREHGAEAGPTRAPTVPGSRAPELDAMSREQLYALVWATPLEQVAKRFEISDVALRNRCVRRNIPTPPRGYWQRKEKGYTVSVIALPVERMAGPQ